MLNKAEKLNILPCKLGIVKENNDSKNLMISRFRVGDKYSSVISSAVG